MLSLQTALLLYTVDVYKRQVLERISSQIASLYEQMDVAATSITKNSTLRGTCLLYTSRCV